MANDSSTTVGKVVLAKVYEAVLRENYAAIMQQVAPKKIDDVALGMEEHFAKLGLDMGQCDVCGGYSPQELPDGTAIDACPFCNTRDVVPDAKHGALAAALATSDQSPPGRTLAAAEVASSMSRRWDIETSRRALDEVNAGCLDLEMRAYVLGTKLNEMRAAGAADALGYATWDDLVDAEVNLVRSTAYRFMAVAASFGADEFRRLGVSKAELLVRLPPGRREKLLPEAASMSVRALREAISDATEAGGERPDGGTKARGRSKDDVTPPLALEAADGDEVERDEVTGEVTSIERTFAITKLGELAGVGVVKGLHGVCLQVAFGRDDSGELVGRLLVLAGTR